jgi:predicted MFS family arabinose efflux permease
MRFRFVSQQQQLLRALSAGIGKTAVILPAAFVTELALGMLTLGMVFYMREVFFLSPALVGWIAATWQGCYVLGCLTMRPVFETLLPRYSMIFSAAGMGMAVTAILLSRSVAAVYIFYGLFGFCLSFFWPPLMSWLSLGIEGKQLSQAMTRLTFVGNIGTIVSPFVAGSLSSLAPRYPLYGATALFCANCLLLIGAALALPRIRCDKQRGRSRRGEPGSPDRSSSLRFSAWVGLFVTFTVLGVIITVFPMFARDDLGLSKSTIGALLLFRALCTAIGYLILGRTTLWHFRPAPMTAGLALLAVLVFGISRASSLPLVASSLALIGPLISLAFSYSFFHGASGASRRATRMAIHEALLASGLIAGSAVGGLLYQHYSMTAVSVFCAALIGAAILTQLLLSGRTR